MIVATGGLPDTGIARARRRSLWSRAGTSWQATPGRATRCCCSTTTAPIPGLQAAEAAGRGRRARSRSSRPSASSRPRSAASTTSPTPAASRSTACGSRSTPGCVAVRREGNRLAAVLGSDYSERTRGAAGRPGGGRARHPAAGRALLRAQAALQQSRRGRLPGAARRPAADADQQSGRALPAVPRSATRSPAATSTPRSTIRCGCARICDRFRSENLC